MMSSEASNNPNLGPSPNMHQQHALGQPAMHPQGMASGSMHDSQMAHDYQQQQQQQQQHQQPNMPQQHQIQQQPNPVNREMIQKVSLCSSYCQYFTVILLWGLRYQSCFCCTHVWKL